MTIGGGGYPGERTISALESQVTCRGGNLSFSGLFPGAQGVAEQEVSGPAAELDRKDEAQVTVFTDLKNLCRIRLDC